MKSLAPDVSGDTLLVEQCQKISINELVSAIQPKIKEELLKTEIAANGYQIGLDTSETALGGERFWFKCPLCGGRKGVLYNHSVQNIIGCRNCLNIEYKSRKYKGMLEASI